MTEPINSKPRIVAIGVGGAGGNAVNNMMAAGLSGVKFVVANTDVQALAASQTEHKIQLGNSLTEGLGAGSRPEIGEAAAEEALAEIASHIAGAHMLFIAAGMGGGTGTGAAYVVARKAREFGILTVAVVTKPFQFEGVQRMRNAEAGIAALAPYVDTLLVIPNENLFRVATDRTTLAEAFVVADQVLYSGIACLVDLIVKEGLINLDLADVSTVLRGMGTAMIGMGESADEQRAITAAEEAIVNPLLDNVTLKGAKSLLLSITGGRDLTLWEVDEAASRVRQEVDPDANIIVGATLDEALGDKLRVAIVASGLAAGVPATASHDVEHHTWVPRAPDHATVADAEPVAYGRRLTEAITERNQQGGTRKPPKPRARSRSNGAAVSNPRDGPQDAAGEQLRAPRQRRSKRPTTSELETQGAAAGSNGSRQNRRRALVLEAPLAAEIEHPVGWPEHWAKGGEAQDRQHQLAEPVEARVSQPSERVGVQRKGTFFGRLASLVGGRRDA